MGAMGMSDLIGWSPKIIDQEDIGHLFAIYTAIEGKSMKGRKSKEQAAFIDLVQRCGGRAGIARSVEDAGKIIRGET